MSGHLSEMTAIRSAGWRCKMRPMSFLDPGAFELSRWRDGRCGVGFPRTLLAV